MPSPSASNILRHEPRRAELAEIDENLVRGKQAPAQEASAIFRRKAIYEELHPETKHGGDAVDQRKI